MVRTKYNRRSFKFDASSNEERLAGLEAAVEHIESSIGDIKNSINTGFTDLHDRIDTQSEQSRPHVQIWTSWIVIGLIVLGFLGSSYVRDLNRVETAVIQMQNTPSSLADPAQNIRLKNIEDAMDFRYNIVDKRINKMEGKHDG